MEDQPILNISSHVDDAGNKVYAAEGSLKGYKFSLVVAIPPVVAGSEDEALDDFTAKDVLISGLVGVIPLSTIPLGMRLSLMALNKVRDAVKKQREGDSEDFNALSAMPTKSDNLSKALDFFSSDLVMP